MTSEGVNYIHDMARELAKLAESWDLDVLAYLLRIVEAEAKEVAGRSVSPQTH